MSPEEARWFVRGPWEFNTGASAQVTDNRTTRRRSYSRPDGKNWDRLGLPESGEFEVELASAPPGDGGVGGQVGVAQDG